MSQYERQIVARAKLEQIFSESTRHVWLFSYSITNSVAHYAIHDGFPFDSGRSLAGW